MEVGEAAEACPQMMTTLTQMTTRKDQQPRAPGREKVRLLPLMLTRWNTGVTSSAHPTEGAWRQGLTEWYQARWPT